jgi:hypothetical protein
MTACQFSLTATEGVRATLGIGQAEFHGLAGRLAGGLGRAVGAHAPSGPVFLVRLMPTGLLMHEPHDIESFSFYTITLFTRKKMFSR